MGRSSESRDVYAQGQFYYFLNRQGAYELRLAASGARHAKKVIDSKVLVEWIVD